MLLVHNEERRSWAKNPNRITVKEIRKLPSGSTRPSAASWTRSAGRKRSKKVPRSLPARRPNWRRRSKQAGNMRKTTIRRRRFALNDRRLGAEGQGLGQGGRLTATLHGLRP